MRSSNPIEPHSKKWDVFISYAHEDKEEVARPLAHLLDGGGLRVWFDEFALQVGDSLSQTIAKGLRDSRFGITIISRAFMAKKWPRNELSAFFALETDENTVILPVWHNIQVADVIQFNPILADRLALQTSDGLRSVASAIKTRIGYWGRAEDENGPVDGQWVGDSGRLLLRYENGQVVGDYDWYGQRWVGSITNGTAGPVINFDWSWTLDSSKGRGFFVDTIRHTRGSGGIRALCGGWWYENDVSDEDAAIYGQQQLIRGYGVSWPDTVKIHSWNFMVPRGPFLLI